MVTVKRPVCTFRCQDTTCLQSWAFVCNGLPDCPDNSDEIHCPFKLIHSNIHYSSFSNDQNIAGIQNVSAIQIIVVAVFIVFTLGLITCVLSHYKMGARSWSERRNRASPHKTPSRDFHHYFHVSHCPQNLNCHCLSSQMPKMILAPVNIEDKKRLTDETIYNKSIQTDITLDLPSTVTMPDGEEYPYRNGKTLHIRNREQENEIYRSYIKPPPNRTVSELNYLASSKSCLENFSQQCTSHSSEWTIMNNNSVASHLKSPIFSSLLNNQLSCRESLSQPSNLCLVSIPSDLNNRTSRKVEDLLDEMSPPVYNQLRENISMDRSNSIV